MRRRIRKVLKLGDDGGAVVALQAALQARGYFKDGATYVDGIFGNGTEVAVKAVQQLAKDKGAVAGIEADGVVREKTLEVLASDLLVDISQLPDKYWPTAEAAMAAQAVPNDPLDRC